MAALHGLAITRIGAASRCSLVRYAQALAARVGKYTGHRRKVAGRILQSAGERDDGSLLVTIEIAHQAASQSMQRSTVFRAAF